MNISYLYIIIRMALSYCTAKPFNGYIEHNMSRAKVDFNGCSCNAKAERRGMDDGILAVIFAMAI